MNWTERNRIIAELKGECWHELNRDKEVTKIQNEIWGECKHCKKHFTDWQVAVNGGNKDYSRPENYMKLFEELPKYKKLAFDGRFYYVKAASNMTYYLDPLKVILITDKDKAIAIAEAYISYKKKGE